MVVMRTFMYTFSVLKERGRQVTIRGSYLDISMGGHFERFEGCEGAFLIDHPHIN